MRFSSARHCISRTQIIRAFTLVEVIISLAILCLIFTFLLVSVRGRKTESDVSMHYFSAACVAHAIIEDLENRCLSNPYALDGIPADLDFTPGEDGPFFSLVEDIDGDGRINKNYDLNLTAGELAERLKEFRCNLKVDRGYANGCAKVDLVIRWKTDGVDKEYRFSHLLADLPGSLKATMMPMDHPTLTDKAVIDALFDEDKPLDELLKAYAVDRETAFQLVELQFYSRMAMTTLLDRQQRLNQLLASPRIQTGPGMVEAADLFEGNSLLILHVYSQLYPLAEKIEDRINGGAFSFGILFLNYKAQNLIGDIAQLADRVDGRSNDGNLSMLFNSNLLSAFDCYLNLCFDPLLSSTATPRKMAAAIERAAHIASTLAQNDYSRMAVTGKTGEKVTLRSCLKDDLTRLKRLSEGRDYNRASFLEKKIKSISSGVFQEYEDVSAKLSVMAGVAGSMSRVLQKLTAGQLLNGVVPPGTER